jgi:hypothetical protein
MACPPTITSAYFAAKPGGKSSTARPEAVPNPAAAARAGVELSEKTSVEKKPPPPISK